MKTRITRLVLLVAACGGFLASPSTAVSADKEVARMYRVGQVFLNGDPVIPSGTSLYLVRQMIGIPDRQLTPDLWLYHNFRSADDAVAKDACGDMLIGFTNDRVSSIHLVTARAREVIVARVNAGKVANEFALATIPEPQPGRAVAAAN